MVFSLLVFALVSVFTRSVTCAGHIFLCVVISLAQVVHVVDSCTVPCMIFAMMSYLLCLMTCPRYKGVDPDTKVGGDGIHVNPERSFGGTNGEPPSEASQLRKGGPGVLPRKISKTYMANGAIYVIPELYL